jgi:hypothetical protein
MDVPLQPRLQSRIAVPDITILTHARRLPQPSQIAASLDAPDCCLSRSRSRPRRNPRGLRIP